MNSIARRYLLTLISGLLTSSVIIFNLWKYSEDRQPNDPVWLLVFALALGLPWSFCAESLNRHRGILRGLVVAAVVGCYVFLIKADRASALMNYAWLVAAAHLLCAFVPVLMEKKDDLDFWKWNTDLFSRFAASALCSGILLAGLLIGLQIFAYLFGIKVPGRVYPTLIATILILFQSTLFVYSSSFDRTLFTSLQNPWQRFVQWILLPLLLLYYVLMIAYGARILITMQLPRGGVAMLVLGYAGVGIFTWLLLWPSKKDPTPLVQFFRKYFLAALIPLMILLGFSLGERIETYGMTERRYGLSVGYIWILIVIAGFGFGQRRPLYWIPATLCAICIFASFGPQGMSGFSRHWQWTRLQRLWEERQTNKDPALNLNMLESYYYLRRVHPDPAWETWISTHPIPDAPDDPRSLATKENVPQTLEIAYQTTRVQEHLSIAYFDIKQDENLTVDDGVLSWKFPGKVLELYFSDAEPTLDFTLDPKVFEGKGNMLNPKFSVLHTTNPKYAIVIQKLDWKEGKDGKNRDFSVQGLLMIQD